MIKLYQNDADVAFVAIQTTFEGFDSNTFKQAKKVAADYKLKIPVGHSGSREKISPLLVNYRGGGTPWTVIIDRSGIVRYNYFHLEYLQAVMLIDKLKLAAPQ
jgi:hypothetical protein